jgi:hypothetical protein
MDKKTKQFINDISKYGVKINFNEFKFLYYDKFFSGFIIHDNDDNEDKINEYNSILKKLLYKMIEDYKKTRNIFIGIGIGAYFLGSFVRDFLIDYIDASTGDIFYIIVYFLWIYGFSWFFIKAYSQNGDAKGINNYIQNDIKDDLTTSKSQVKIIENSLEIKLLKLKEMYDKKLINEDEYNTLRKKTLENL